jgi:hypothetical protein
LVPQVAREEVDLIKLPASGYSGSSVDKMTGNHLPMYPHLEEEKIIIFPNQIPSLGYEKVPGPIAGRRQKAPLSRGRPKKTN